LAVRAGRQVRWRSGQFFEGIAIDLIAFAEGQFRHRARSAPECPLEVLHVWDWFVALNASRQIGMAMNPISHSDIAAFAAGMDVEIRPWEWGLICRVDQAVLPILNGPKTAKADNETDTEDGAGVKAMMRGMGAQKGKS
jgi:hypothetical protein